LKTKVAVRAALRIYCFYNVKILLERLGFAQHLELLQNYIETDGQMPAKLFLLTLKHLKMPIIVMLIKIL